MRVFGEGPKTAKVLVVAEAPGAEEAERGRPLVGPSGQLLERWWMRVGLFRHQMRLDNVVQVRPPGNKLDALDEGEIDGWIQDLRLRLTELPEVELVVAVGNLALRSLTGKVGITKWRGSLLETSVGGRVVRCIPTIHPAAALRTPSWEKRCIRDWMRVKEVAEEVGRFKPPECKYVIAPTYEQVETYAHKVWQMGDKGALGVDIETPGNVVGCIGFALDPFESLTVPTVPWFWGPKASAVWSLVQFICELPIAKVLQNGFYDTFYLQRLHRIEMVNYLWDLMAMHHCLDSMEDHDLAFMASVYTWRPFWKDEAKDSESIQKYASNAEALWTYNGMDACGQRDLFDVFYKLIEDAGKVEFYHRHYSSLFPMFFDLMCHGIQVDEERRAGMLVKLEGELKALEGEINATTGVTLFGKKSISPKKLLEWLKSNKVKVPTKKQTNGKRGETTDETALLKVGTKYPKVKPVLDQILLHRGTKKQCEFLDPKRNDADQRMRSQYKFTTGTGRMASTKNPFGTGANAQNIDRKLRVIYVPDRVL